MAEEVREIHLDFDQLREGSNLWLRRASVFMGIGTNAAAISPPLSHTLSDAMQYHFVAQNPTPEQQRHFVDEFEVWVISNGLRDLIEGHSVFLDGVYGNAVLVNRGTMSFRDLAKLEKEFEPQNISHKRQLVCAELGVEDLFSDMFSSMVKARNCMAHRNGVVGRQDVNTDTNDLVLSWRFHGVVLVEENRRIDLNRNPESGHVLQGGTIGIKLLDEARRFHRGAQIRLTRHDLSEICMAFSTAAETTIATMIELAKKRGIKADIKPAAPPAGVAAS